MSGYRASRYLNVVDLDGSALLFNGVNGCLDELSGKPAEIFLSGSRERLTELSPEETATLLERGHLTALSPGEELARFRELAAALHCGQEKSSKAAGIMLLMSYNCNLACKYCYQQEHRPHKSGVVMTAEMVDNIFGRHLSSIIPGAEPKNCNISFYGGEPFLPANLPVIRRALWYAKKYGMPSSAITNATLVDAMPEIFGPGPGLVGSVQVSLDGTRELHDSSRVPAGGGKTYDRILDNIAMLIDRKTRVSIRLNLDRRTLDSVPELLKDLKGRQILGNKFAGIYASPLHDNIARVDATDFMDMADLSSRVFGLGIDLEHPVSLRANELSRLFRLKKGLGLTRTAFCMQTMQRTLVVDPFGDLYACFEEAGYPEYRVGHLSADGAEFFPLHGQYKTRHIANMPECLECSVALACGGQCGVKCRTRTGDLFRPHCADTKKVILESVKLAYQRTCAAGKSAVESGEPDLVSVHG
ncbi:MAG TPA: radical SAM protein [Elusimicrobiales bacterium]|nr:radical SAM protein [Elusimicrobiales bacterium]